MAVAPSTAPSMSSMPSLQPSLSTSPSVSSLPSASTHPSSNPSLHPSFDPTSQPSTMPSDAPSAPEDVRDTVADCSFVHNADYSHLFLFPTSRLRRSYLLFLASSMPSPKVALQRVSLYPEDTIPPQKHLVSLLALFIHSSVLCFFSLTVKFSFLV